MERRQPDNSPSAVNNRWWAEVGRDKKKGSSAPPSPVGSRFYRAGQGFEQEKARERLTDNNLKVLRLSDPQEGQWTYVSLGDRVMAPPQRERIERAVSLPGYARGVFVDCGKYARLIATGTPVGERILELTLGGAPSFDCWIRDDWVKEEVYRSTDEAIKAFRRALEQYLSPSAIERLESITAKV